MVGIQTALYATTNHFLENHIQAVFTAENISEDLRELENLENTVGLDAAAAEAQCKALPQIFNACFDLIL